MRTIRSVSVLAAVAMLAAAPLTAQASHAWGSYHWAHTSTPFTLKVVDSMTSNWDTSLDTAIVDWGQSTVLDLTKEPGESTPRARKRCSAVSGKVRVCNATYGNNGWLGLAQIWASGSHITQAVAKMNDSYLASSSYTDTNRQHVVCQEIGHDFGLGHQDESGANLNTCMDYSSALDNPHPNQHDYDQLEAIYSHLDAAASVSAKRAGFGKADVHARKSWGRKVLESANGRSAIFVRDYGAGLKIVTHVTWAQ